MWSPTQALVRGAGRKKDIEVDKEKKGERLDKKGKEWGRCS